jgi:hypothetical protein
LPGSGSTRDAAIVASFPQVAFSGESLSPRDTALLELVLRLASTVVMLRSTGDDDADSALMTFVLGLAAQSFPDVAFELRAPVEIPLEEII